MIEVTRSELLPGVHLTAVHTKKFKSSVLGLQFLLLQSFAVKFIDVLRG